ASSVALRQQLFFADEPGDHWVRGTSYKARAWKGGFRYIPFLGSKAPRNMPVDFRLRSAQLGDRDLPLNSAAVATREGNRFILDRGPVQVRYDLELEAVEQSFLLDVAGADEDLVLEIDVQTELDSAHESSGLAFTGQRGGVSYSAAFALDGVGRRTDVPVELEGSTIRLTVPAEFLASATGPVLVDPWIATFSVDQFGSVQGNVEISYDATHNRALFVYEDYFSIDDYDAYGRVMDLNSMAFSWVGYLEQTENSWLRPRAANCAALDEWMIVAERVEVLDTVTSIVGRRLSAASLILQPEFTVSRTDGVRVGLPDIAGDNGEGTLDPKFLVAWQVENSFGSGIGVEARTVDANTQVLGATRVWAGAGSTQGFQVALSKSNSRTAGLDTWNAAYGFRTSAAGPNELAVALIDSTGHPVVSRIAYTSSPGGAAVDADISDSIVVGTGLPKCLISFEEVQDMGRTKPLLLWDGVSAPTAFDLNEMEHGPTDSRTFGLRVGTTNVMSGQPEFLVSYHERISQQSSNIYVSTLDIVGNRGLAISEGREFIAFASDTAFDESQAGLCTLASGGAVSERALIGFTRFQGTSNSPDAFVAVFDATNPTAVGEQFCSGVPNSTGERGLLLAYGDAGATTPHSLFARQLPSSSIGFFVVGMGGDAIHQPGGSQGVLCLGGGGIGRYSNFASSSGALGQIGLTIQPDSIPTPSGPTAAIAGEAWNFQLWHRDSVGGMATSNFTNAVRIGFL
ncbi:MAG: hypothetical protein AAGG01_08095, partial [Planctomycetota bacterium]